MKDKTGSIIYKIKYNHIRIILHAPISYCHHYSDPTLLVPFPPFLVHARAISYFVSTLYIYNAHSSVYGGLPISYLWLSSHPSVFGTQWTIHCSIGSRIHSSTLHYVHHCIWVCIPAYICTQKLTPLSLSDVRNLPEMVGRNGYLTASFNHFNYIKCAPSQHQFWRRSLPAMSAHPLTNSSAHLCPSTLNSAQGYNHILSNL